MNSTAKQQINKLKQNNLYAILDITLDYLYEAQGQNEATKKIKHEKIVYKATKIAKLVYQELLDSNLSLIIDKIAKY